MENENAPAKRHNILGKNKRVAHGIARGLDGEVGNEGSAMNTFERIRDAG